MASDWIETTLGELCTQQGGSIQTGPFGSQLHASDYSEIGTPVVMPINLVDGNVSKQGIARVGSEHVAKLSKHKLKPGDIVFSRRGDVTRFALVSDRESGWLCGTGCLKISLGEPALAIPQFVAGVLSLPETKEWLVQHAVGATMPNLNTGILAAIPVRLPDLSTQKQAAKLLYAMKDRIDSLSRANATLEAIAQALFKSWFVDFDPVRAKAEGREPEGMDAATAALFPSEFEDSELGPIPRGWSCSRFGELLVERSERVRNQEAIVMSAVRSGKLVRSDEHFNKRVHSADISKYKLVQPLAFAYNPSRINIGSIGLNEGGAVGAVSPIYVVAEASGAEVAYFVWHHLRTEAVKRRIVGLCSGSVRQSLSAADFFSLPVVIPDARILSAFHSVRQSLHDKVHSNESQASLLADMRDTLLPQLISGKLRLPEAEAAVEKALV